MGPSCTLNPVLTAWSGPWGIQRYSIPSLDSPIGPLRRSDLGAASRLLARAFRENPLNRAVMPGGSERARVRANAAGLRSQLGSALRHGEILAARGDWGLCGVLVAARPGGYPFPSPSLADQLRVLLAQGTALAGRWSDVFDALHAVHPTAPHFHLSLLGVEPAYAGKRIGSALLRGFLAMVDAERMPAYLETDLARNVGLYERAGFAVVGELVVQGVRVWRMGRAAR